MSRREVEKVSELALVGDEDIVTPTSRKMVGVVSLKRQVHSEEMSFLRYFRKFGNKDTYILEQVRSHRLNFRINDLSLARELITTKFPIISINAKKRDLYEEIVGQIESYIENIQNPEEHIPEEFLEYYDQFEMEGFEVIASVIYEELLHVLGNSSLKVAEEEFVQEVALIIEQLVKDHVLSSKKLAREIAHLFSKGYYNTIAVTRILKRVLAYPLQDDHKAFNKAVRSIINEPKKNKEHKATIKDFLESKTYVIPLKNTEVVTELVSYIDKMIVIASSSSLEEKIKQAVDEFAEVIIESGIEAIPFALGNCVEYAENYTLKSDYKGIKGEGRPDGTKCKYCRHDKFHKYSEQTRSIDEGATWLKFCAQCERKN